MSDHQQDDDHYKQQQQQQQQEEQQHQGPAQQPPTSASAIMSILDPQAEFDLEELGPTMRSVGVMRAPTATTIPALPSHYHRHQGAYLYRDGAGASSSSSSSTTASSSTSRYASMEVPKTGAAGAGAGAGALLEGLVLPSRPKPATAEEVVAPPTLYTSISTSAPTLPFDTALFPLERCHYYTNKPAGDLHTDIEAALQEKGVVFTFAADKFKFICEYLAGVNMVKFVCRAYFVPEDGRTVVEFQRRAGCCIVCTKVVESIRSTLLARECNAESAPITTKPFKAKALDIATVCVLHEHEDSAQAAAVEAELKAQQEAQQCKLMDDLRRSLAGGKDEILKDFSKVLIPLSQLAPEHFLSTESYPELLSALGAHASVTNARLGALACVANLAATYFNDTEPAAASGEEEEGEGEEGNVVPLPKPTPAQVQAWFEGVLPMVVKAVGEEKDPHVRRAAARALMHLSKEGFARTEEAKRALEVCEKGEGGKDQLLQSYVNAALRNM